MFLFTKVIFFHLFWITFFLTGRIIRSCSRRRHQFTNWENSGFCYLWRWCCRQAWWVALIENNRKDEIMSLIWLNSYVEIFFLQSFKPYKAHFKALEFLRQISIIYLLEMYKYFVNNCGLYSVAFLCWRNWGFLFLQWGGKLFLQISLSFCNLLPMPPPMLFQRVRQLSEDDS